MRIAVTGGAGYIGSVVTEVLIQDGHEVLVLDNLAKGHRDAVTSEAIFVEVDLLDRLSITAMLQGFRCDAVAAAGRRPHITIFGDDYPTPDGTCIRDYVHVEDLARAHILALGGLAAPGICRVYNLGCGGEGYSVRDVVDTARQVTGREIPIQLAQRRPGDPARLVASSERIRRELGWAPRYPELAPIISSAWQWLQRRNPIDR
jgi:UDP-glucose 4-epimerase